MSEPNTENNIQDTGIPTLTMTVSASQEVQWPVDDTLSISEMAADAKATGDAIADVEAALADVESEIQHIVTVAYPVGSIYMTISAEAPDFDGTWVEIAVTATWAQLKSGKRDYALLPEGDTGGDVHFWLRTA